MKRSVSIIYAVCLAMIALSSPLSVAAGSGDEKCDLTICYRTADTAVSETEVALYRVANIDEAEGYVPCDGFDRMSISFEGIRTQTDWKKLALSLSAAITAEKTSPYRTCITDDSGAAGFAGINPGLYLIKGFRCERDGTTFVFENALAVLPVVDETGETVYEQTLLPKYESFSTFKDDKQYRVNKLWKDLGAESERPENVRIKLFRDGVHEGPWS